METTYTVLRKDGEVLRRGLTDLEAVDEILGHDGYLWSVQKDPFGCFVLYVSERSSASCGGAGDMIPTDTWSTGETLGEALHHLAGSVIRSCSGWRKCPDVMTDAAYDAMLAQLLDDTDEGPEDAGAVEGLGV